MSIRRTKGKQSLSTHLLGFYSNTVLRVGVTQMDETKDAIYWEKQAHNSNTCCIVCSKCYRSTEGRVTVCQGKESFT